MSAEQTASGARRRWAASKAASSAGHAVGRSAWQAKSSYPAGAGEEQSHVASSSSASVAASATSAAAWLKEDCGVEEDEDEEQDAIAADDSLAMCKYLVWLVHWVSGRDGHAGAPVTGGQLRKGAVLPEAVEFRRANGLPVLTVKGKPQGIAIGRKKFESHDDCFKVEGKRPWRVSLKPGALKLLETDTPDKPDEKEAEAAATSSEEETGPVRLLAAVDVKDVGDAATHPVAEAEGAAMAAATAESARAAAGGSPSASDAVASQKLALRDYLIWLVLRVERETSKRWVQSTSLIKEAHSEAAVQRCQTCGFQADGPDGIPGSRLVSYERFPEVFSTRSGDGGFRVLAKMEWLKQHPMFLQEAGLGGKRGLGFAAAAEEGGVLATGASATSATADASQRDVPDRALTEAAAAMQAVAPFQDPSAAAAAAAASNESALAPSDMLQRVELTLSELEAKESEPKAEELTSLLAQYGRMYTKQQFARTCALGRWEDAGDAAALEKAFQADIKTRGFLTADCVLSEIHGICQYRRWNQGRLLAAADGVGDLLKGLLKMLTMVEAVLHFTFATQTLVTIHDLEQTLLRTSAFKHVKDSGFAAANLGALYFHPEVSKRCGLARTDLPPWRALPGFPPEIPSSQLMRELFGKATQAKMDDLFNPEGFVVEEMLNGIAQASGLRDYRDLGVYVQRDWVVKTVLRCIRLRAPPAIKTPHGTVQMRGDMTSKVSQAADRLWESVVGTGKGFCDWQQWSSALQQFARLHDTKEALNFAIGLTPSLLGALPVTEVVSAGDTLEVQGQMFVQLVLGPLLCASFMVVKKQQALQQAQLQAGTKKGAKNAKKSEKVPLNLDGFESVAKHTLTLGKLLPSMVSQDGQATGVAETIRLQLQAYPDQEPKFADVLLRAEKALLAGCGVTLHQQLPVSLATLLAADRSLSETLDAVLQSAISPGLENSPLPQLRGHASPDDDGALAEILADLVERDLAAREASRMRGVDMSLQELLECVGQGESTLCRHHGLTAGDFHKLGTGSGFGAFLKRHAERLLAHVMQKHSLAGASSQSREIAEFCKQVCRSWYGRAETDMDEEDYGEDRGLKSLEAEVKSRAAAHYGAVIGPAELDAAASAALSDVSACRFPDGDHKASGIPKLQPLLSAAGVFSAPLQRSTTSHAAAVDELRSAPLMFDLAEALPHWDATYGPTLGTMGMFLQANAQSLSSLRLMEVRAGVFVRLLTGTQEELAGALRRKDPRSLACSVLSRLLADGVNAPVQHFQVMMEESYGQWAAEDQERASGSLAEIGGTVEHFVLEAVASLPREARDMVAPVIAQPFRTKRHPERWLVAAVTSAEKAIACRWLGHHFGVLEWQLLSFEDIAYACQQKLVSPSQLQPAAPSPPAEATKAKEVIAPAPEAALPAQAPEAAPTQHREQAAAKTTMQSAEVPEMDSGNLALCRDVARLKGVSLDGLTADRRDFQQSDGTADEATRSLQRSLQGAVKRLAAELYSTETHFLLELLQNVDDCSYSPGVRPSLCLTIETDRTRFAGVTTFKDSGASPPEALLSLDYNELGFEEKHVRALCDIARSTKAQEQRKFIGAKGIGFKSVFRVTTTPVVHSGPFSFHFDAAALGGLGYLLPFPLPPLPEETRESLGTRLVLPLHDQKTYRDIKLHIEEELPPTLLLFLRNLRNINVMVRDQAGAVLQKRMAIEVSDQITSLSTEISSTTDGLAAPSVEQQEQLWFVHRHRLSARCSPVAAAMNTPGQSVDAAGVPELQLAFRIQRAGGCADKEPLRPMQQQAFAWLPLRSYGFRFIVQADWEVPSSREAITETSHSNQAVREELATAFRAAAEAMVKRACEVSGAALPVDVASDIAGLSSPAASGGGADETLQGKKLQHLQQMLADLYMAIPMPGEVAEFFRNSPKAILQMLKEAKVVVVRRRSSAAGAQRSAEIAVATPQTAVRTALPPRQLHELTWSSCLEEALEPLLNLAGLHFEVGGMQDQVASELGLRCVDSSVAVECLAFVKMVMTEQAAAAGADADDAAATLLAEDHLRLLHNLLLLVALDPHPPLSRLKDMVMLPTADGTLVAAAQSQLYDVGAELGAFVGTSKLLDPRFSAQLHPRVVGLLQSLGVVRADGLQFLQDVLVPALTCLDQPQREVLLSCTEIACRIVASLDDSGKRRAFEVLRRGDLWVVAAQETVAGEQERIMRFGSASGSVLHLSRLPSLLQAVYPGQWLHPSRSYAARHGDQQLQWQSFWTGIGVWPAVALEHPDQQQPSHSTELKLLFEVIRSSGSSQQPEMAKALLHFLAPHGRFYEQHLQSRPSESSDCASETAQVSSPACFGRLFTEFAFLPTRDDRLAFISETWMPESAASSSPLEDPHTISAEVKAFVHGWPKLHIATRPTLTILVRILRGLTKAMPVHSVADCAALYAKVSALYTAVYEEETSDAKGVLSDDDLRFLRSGSWVFVPDHPHLPHASARLRFDEKGQRISLPGSFWRPQDLVFRDEAWLFDSYKMFMSDEACNMAREAACLRVVGNYYWGRNTLFPPALRHKPTSVLESVHNLLEALGVRYVPALKDYISVLKALHRYDSTAAHKLFIQTFGYLAREIEEELKEAADAEVEEESEEPKEQDTADNLALSPAVQALTRKVPTMYKASKTLMNFLQQAALVPCIPTAAGTWEPLVRIRLPDFWATDGWSKDALSMQLMPIRESYEGEVARKALQACGVLSHPVLHHRVVADEVQPVKEERSLCRAMLLAALRWVALEALDMGSSFSSERWETLSTAMRSGISTLEVLQAVSSADAAASSDNLLERQEWLTIEEDCASPAEKDAASTDKLIFEDVKHAFIARKAEASGSRLARNVKVVQTRSMPLPAFTGRRSGEEHICLVVAAMPGQSLMLAGEIQVQLVDAVLSWGVHSSLEGESDSVLMSPEIDAFKRRFLRRLQDIAGKLTAPEDALSGPSAAVEAAARAAGYAGPGGSADLDAGDGCQIADSAGDGSDAARAEETVTASSAQKWSAAASSSLKSDNDVRLIAPSASTFQEAGGLLAAATAALGPPRTQTANQQSSSTSTFGSALPLGPAKEQATKPDEQQQPTASGAMGALAGGGGDGSNVPSSIAGTGQNAGGRLDLGFFFAGMRWSRGLSSERSTAGGWTAGQSATQAGLKLLLPLRQPEGLAVEAPTGELTEESSVAVIEQQQQRLLEIQRTMEPDLAMGMVGVLGEEVAAKGLQEMGFDVAWVNRLGERKWPFDLAVRDLQGGKRRILSRLFHDPRALDRDCKELERLVAEGAAAGEAPIVLVEVKASLGEPTQASSWSDAFHISSSEVALASKLGPRFWLARLHNLGTANAKLTIFRDMSAALHSGRLHLLLLA